MDATIRRATIADAAAIAFVHVASWRSTYAGIVPDAYLASLSQQDRAESWEQCIAGQQAIVLVAEAEAGVFGFVCGGTMREPIASYEAELYAIYLLHDRQRRGTGRRLAESLVSALHAEGFKGMAVWVLEKNPAVAFYKRLGAIQIAEKTIDIGGSLLEELALGWPDLDLGFDRKAANAADAVP